VFIVDDDEAIRDSLHWLLEANGHHVQCFSSALEFLEAYMPLRNELVACLVLDVRMRGMSGLELQEQLLIEGVVLPVLFMTGHGDVPMAVSTMKKGAVDFLEKPFDETRLRQLVEQMLESARAARRLAQQQQDRTTRLARLTARERQVLERITAGRLNKQIADDLEISIKTVEAHRANIMEKLKVGTVADLLRLTLETGTHPAHAS